MQGVVTLLDAKHDRRVGSLWAKWRRASGFPAIGDLQIPHFSYHIAENYDAARLAWALAKVARATPAFRVQASGLGIFTGRRKILYIAIARDEQLDRLHRRIARAVGPTAAASSPFYDRSEWIPHITLADGEMEGHRFARLLADLSGGDFRWELPVRNLALLISERGRHAVKLRFPLRG